MGEAGGATGAEQRCSIRAQAETQRAAHSEDTDRERKGPAARLVFHFAPLLSGRPSFPTRVAVGPRPPLGLLRLHRGQEAVHAAALARRGINPAALLRPQCPQKPVAPALRRGGLAWPAPRVAAAAAAGSVVSRIPGGPAAPVPAPARRGEKVLRGDVPEPGAASRSGAPAALAARGAERAGGPGGRGVAARAQPGSTLLVPLILQPRNGGRRRVEVRRSSHGPISSSTLWKDERERKARVDPPRALSAGCAAAACP